MTTYIPRTLTYVDDRGEHVEVQDSSLPLGRRALVVLGEPGMGKTELMRQLAMRPGFHFQTARSLVRRRPEALAPGHFLVIDALDELASAREEDPVHEVLTYLIGAKMPPFVLSCRSAEWRGASARPDIESEYGEKPLELRIKPLSQSDATAYLSQFIPRTRAVQVVEELATREFESFFGNPLTLHLLGRIVQEQGDLPATRGELFERSTDLLWREHDERRPRSPRSNLDPGSALDAAGAAGAALIIGGREAISLKSTGHVPSSDLHIAEVAALPAADALAAVVGSALFVRPDREDRAAPLHRTVAEYLGARWLAREAKSLSQRRVMSLLTFNGGVPASVRGLHAWLAHFSRDLAPDVIRSDPYGVLRYGDVSTLSTADSRLLFAELQALSRSDPHFRSGDWATVGAPILVQPALLDDVRRVLADHQAEVQFRMLLLEALEHAPAAAKEASEQLAEILQHEGSKYVYSERSAAADALLAADVVDWEPTLRSLAQRDDPDSRRLSTEIASIGSKVRVSTDTLALVVLAYLGLLPGRNKQAHVQAIGPLYGLARGVPQEQVGELLDQLAASVPSEEREWRVRHELSELTYSLVERWLADGNQPDPERLLQWLKLAAGDRTGSDRHPTLRALLSKGTGTREAIQAQVLFHGEEEDTLWGRAWHLQELDAALYPTPDDLLVLLQRPEVSPPDTVERKELWKDLALLGRRSDGMVPELLAAFRSAAGRDGELRAHLRQITSKKLPEWERKRRAKDRAYQRNQQKKWEGHRAQFTAARAAIEAGEIRWVSPLAQAYLGHYHDVSGDTPRERLRNWLGDEVLASALIGFEAVLSRADLPTAEQVAASYAESKRWHVMLPILAALCERTVENSTDIKGLSNDLLISARLGLLHEHVDEKYGGAAIAKALDDRLCSEPSVLERYLRLAIEQQLIGTGTDHVFGLHQTLRLEGVDDVLLPLVVHWLSQSTPIRSYAERELIDYLVRKDRVDELRDLAQVRVRLASPEDRLTWLTLSFLTDFEGARPELEAAATENPEILWQIRDRGGFEFGDRTSPRNLTLDRLAWVVRTFRKAYPFADHPSGGWSGNHNPWDASEFILACIRKIAADTSDAAIEILQELQSEGTDSYTRYLRAARADQLAARREADFDAPSLETISAVLRSAPPSTPTDLLAVVLDALATVQAWVRGDELDSVNNFYAAEEPIDENGCRDQLMILMRGALPREVGFITERDMPRGKRADIAFTSSHELQIPVEAKGQWHPKLWTAAATQLEALYTTEWRASGVGLYLVFWFGRNVADGRQLRPPPKGTAPPATATELQAALEARIPAHRRGALSVFVLDVSR